MIEALRMPIGEDSVVCSRFERPKPRSPKEKEDGCH